MIKHRQGARSVLKRATVFGSALLAAAIVTTVLAMTQTHGTGLPTVTTQRGTEEFPGVDVVLEAPPEGFEPAVSAEKAAEFAASRWPDGDVSLATLVTFTNPAMRDESGLIFDHLPAWVVRVEKVCVPVLGGRDSSIEPGECAGNQISVVVDASSGQWIQDYSQQDPQSDSARSASPAHRWAGSQP